LKNLKAAILEKRRGEFSRGVQLLHDNAPVHKSAIASAAVRDLGFQELNHPPYSSDLAPSNFYQFRHLKKHLRGRKFSDDEEVKCAVLAFFTEQDSIFFSDGNKGLPSKWNKFIE
jgi:[histone H3]-lysine36 N-dimethyltransferase SETMAR